MIFQLQFLLKNFAIKGMSMGIRS